MSKAYHYNPPPKYGKKVVLEYVLNALEQRALAGYEKYGTPLMTFNGRDPLRDAFEDALDLCMYLAQKIMEEEEINGEEKEKETQEKEFIRLMIPRKVR